MKGMRRIIFGDKEFVKWQHEKFGIDLLGRQATKNKSLAGLLLDPYYFFDGPESVDRHLKEVL